MIIIGIIKFVIGRHHNKQDICVVLPDFLHRLNPVVKMQQHYQEVRECVKDYFDCIVGTVMSNKLAVLVPCDKDSQILMF